MGWYKPSSAVQKLSQRVANRLLWTSHWKGSRGYPKLQEGLGKKEFCFSSSVVERGKREMLSLGIR